MTFDGIICSFLLRERKLPYAIRQLLQSPAIWKIGVGARGGLFKLHSNGVLTHQARNVTDIDYFLKESTQWNEPVDVMFRNEKIVPFRGDRNSILHKQRPSADIKRLVGLDKMVFLATYEDMYSTSKVNESSQNRFFGGIIGGMSRNSVTTKRQ